ncbi:hypothetical protein HFN88_33545 [Rhizobium laguerreae]|uniref:hypothetical protein n=1 Tax=Rhizobium laguerreae TaxID=1076926 RepID=UPI0013F14B09|nr:hypothetical protein [Rhizobium laguerreae]MBY3397543.1 hypothetical protein [Rhizobium laguerreae]MBY3423865.1 hypothetical protein [Rhizobium laguerreae]MBY3475911.1 hypothetical protein [Rhizobium laguerreae]MBY3496643.1 hypothetical protein [Rhizobium laguerreae]MBY3523848.1 hypothetical protein [Rhizobium laguerreae]
MHDLTSCSSRCGAAKSGGKCRHFHICHSAHNFTIHMFFNYCLTATALRALPLLTPPADSAAAGKQTPYSSILDEKNYTARKILLALWYLYVIFSSELRKVSAARRSWDLPKWPRLPLLVKEPKLAAACIIAES